MRNRMQEQLEVLLDTITMNICYPVSPGDLELLRQQVFYFNICTIIFPQLNIKIIKIGQDQSLSSNQKMQKLLQLLTEQLQINLAALSGQEILSGNFLHTYKFLKILKEFSELPPLQFNPPKDKFRQRLHSCPITYSSQIDNTKQPQSARIQSRQRNLTHQKEECDQNMQIFLKQNKQKEIQQEKECSLSQKDKNKNVLKDNKNKKQDKNICNKSPKLQKSKNRKKGCVEKKILKKNPVQKQQNKSNKKFKSYLQGMMKTQKSKKKKINSSLRPKSANKVSWEKEVKEIDQFFKSFQYRIRDQKHKYLKKMQQIIRAQQNDRMRIQQKLNLERAKSIERHQKNMLCSLMNTHKTKIDILKERAQSNKQSISLIKKQQEQELRTSKKQVMTKRKEQLKQIKNYITQLNNKILMKLEQGGELQKIVQSIYSKL